MANNINSNAQRPEPVEQYIDDLVTLLGKRYKYSSRNRSKKDVVFYVTTNAITESYAYIEQCFKEQTIPKSIYKLLYQS